MVRSDRPAGLLDRAPAAQSKGREQPFPTLCGSRVSSTTPPEPRVRAEEVLRIGAGPEEPQIPEGAEQLALLLGVGSVRAPVDRLRFRTDPTRRPRHRPS